MSAPDIATPTQRRQFLAILSQCVAGDTISANTYHDDAKLAAQLPASAMGGLFRSAAEAGYLFRVGFVRATDPAAKGRWLVQWERTTKPIPAEQTRAAS